MTKSKYSQLDLLKPLYQTDTTETVFVDSMIERMKNIVYIRTLVKFSELKPDKKTASTKALTDCLALTGQLLWKVSRQNLKYKDKQLADFTALGADPAVYMDHVPEKEKIKEAHLSEERRLNGMFLAFKAVTAGYGPTVQRIKKQLRLSTLEIL